MTHRGLRNKIDQTGVALIELVLTLPLLIVILAGTVDYGLLFFRGLSVASLSRDLASRAARECVADPGNIQSCLNMMTLELENDWVGARIINRLPGSQMVVSIYGDGAGAPNPPQRLALACIPQSACSSESTALSPSRFRPNAQFRIDVSGLTNENPIVAIAEVFIPYTPLIRTPWNSYAQSGVLYEASIF